MDALFRGQAAVHHLAAAAADERRVAPRPVVAARAVRRADGATILYVVWIQPLVKKHEERIDSALESGRKSAEENLLVLKSKGIQWVRSGSQRGVRPCAVCCSKRVTPPGALADRRVGGCCSPVGRAGQPDHLAHERQGAGRQGLVVGRAAARRRGALHSRKHSVAAVDRQTDRRAGGQTGKAGGGQQAVSSALRPHRITPRLRGRAHARRPAAMLLAVCDRTSAFWRKQAALAR
eukprot:scaffold2213_cov444-Prasinococcus_capsulatus_cf.AAC.12